MQKTKEKTGNDNAKIGDGKGEKAITGVASLDDAMERHEFVAAVSGPNVHMARGYTSNELLDLPS